MRVSREDDRYYGRKYYHKNRDKLLERSKEYNLKIREQCLEAYGNMCSCECGCREDEPHFLSLDHLNKDDPDKKVARSGSSLYLFAKKMGWPSTLRLLCHNCNQGRYYNGGICPRLTTKNSQKIEEN